MKGVYLLWMIGSLHNSKEWRLVNVFASLDAAKAYDVPARQIQYWRETSHDDGQPFWEIGYPADDSAVKELLIEFKEIQH